MRKILIIDDEKDLCFLLAAVLEANLNEVRMAHTLADGLELLNGDWVPELLFLDLNLPDGFGPDLLQQEISNLESTRVVLITAFSDQMGAPETWDPRVQAIIDKPFSINEIEAYVNPPGDSQN